MGLDEPVPEPERALDSAFAVEGVVPPLHAPNARATAQMPTMQAVVDAFIYAFLTLDSRLFVSCPGFSLDYLGDMSPDDGRVGLPD
jgi:hypothetical protein